MKYLLSALCITLALGLTAANAETATTPSTSTTTTTTTAPKKPAATKPRSAKSIECSKLADAKGLHGKDRRVFRAKCKKGEPTQ